MKVRVVETNQIINVKRDFSKMLSEELGYLSVPDQVRAFYTDENGKTYSGYELDFNCTPTDWEQRRFELAKAALQGILSNESSQYTANRYTAMTVGEKYNGHRYAIAKYAVACADALIDELKGE